MEAKEKEDDFTCHHKLEKCKEECLHCKYLNNPFKANL